MKHYVAYRQDRVGGAARLQLVRDGTSLWAGLFGPLWALGHGLPWLAALLLGVDVALMGLVTALDGDGAAQGLVSGALFLLIALSASDLRCTFLELKGFRMVGVASGRNLTAAERSLFQANPELAYDLIARDP